MDFYNRCPVSAEIRRVFPLPGASIWIFQKHLLNCSDVVFVYTFFLVKSASEFLLTEQKAVYRALILRISQKACQHYSWIRQRLLSFYSTLRWSITQIYHACLDVCLTKNTVAGSLLSPYCLHLSSVEIVLTLIFPCSSSPCLILYMKE